MSCEITAGKALLVCKDVVSGIKNIYFSNFGDFDYEVGVGVTGGAEQTIVNITGPTSGTPDFYQYATKNSGTTFQQDITSSRDNGTTFFNQTLNFVLTKLSPEMELQVKRMSWGNPQIIVESNSGLFFLMGKEHGCEISGNSQIQGTMDSLNGYTLTAVGMEKAPIYYLTQTAIDYLKLNLSPNNIDG